MAVSHLFKDSKLYFKSSTNSSLYNRLGHLIRNCSPFLILCNIIMALFCCYPNIVAILSCKMSCTVHHKNSVAMYKLDNYGLIWERVFESMSLIFLPGNPYQTAGCSKFKTHHKGNKASTGYWTILEASFLETHFSFLPLHVTRGTSSLLQSQRIEIAWTHLFECVDPMTSWFIVLKPYYPLALLSNP